MAWEDVACIDWNAKIVHVFYGDKIELNKIYIYQKYREYLVEFESLEKWEAFKAYANENLPYWNWDCPIAIDTSDAEQCDFWFDYFNIEREMEE